MGRRNFSFFISRKRFFFEMRSFKKFDVGANKISGKSLKAAN